MDHVSDVIWLAIEDDRVPLRWRPKRSEIKGAAVVKEEGNAAIKRGKPREAVELQVKRESSFILRLLT